MTNILKQLDWSKIQYIKIRYNDDGSYYMARQESEIIPTRTFKIVARKYKDSDIIERNEEGLD